MALLPDFLLCAMDAEESAARRDLMVLEAISKALSGLFGMPQMVQPAASPRKPGTDDDIQEITRLFGLEAPTERR